MLYFCSDQVLRIIPSSDTEVQAVKQLFQNLTVSTFFHQNSCNVKNVRGIMRNKIKTHGKSLLWGGFVLFERPIISIKSFSPPNSFISFFQTKPFIVYHSARTFIFFCTITVSLSALVIHEHPQLPIRVRQEFLSTITTISFRNMLLNWAVYTT